MDKVARSVMKLVQLRKTLNSILYIYIKTLHTQERLGAIKLKNIKPKKSRASRVNCRKHSRRQRKGHSTCASRRLRFHLELVA